MKMLCCIDLLLHDAHLMASVFLAMSGLAKKSGMFFLYGDSSST